MPKVIGFHRSSFSFEDGRTSTGYTLYLGMNIRTGEGSGMMTERVYLSDAKLNGYLPKLNDEVLIDRTRNGSARGLYELRK